MASRSNGLLSVKLFALTVGKNENNRYLSRFFEWTQSFTDGHFFYDDQSTDGTVWTAAQWAVTRTREVSVPSFMEHEGIFRQSAFQAFCEDMPVDEGDWIISLDCDEFLVTKGNQRDCLEHMTNMSITPKLPVVEIFGVDQGRFSRRVDGFWKGITAARYFPWDGKLRMNLLEMGGGSVPTSVKYGPALPEMDAALLHLGYFADEDKQAKYLRYAGSRNNGHASSHIQSIITSPKVIPWLGKVPYVLEDLL